MPSEIVSGAPAPVLILMCSDPHLSSTRASVMLASAVTNRARKLGLVDEKVNEVPIVRLSRPGPVWALGTYGSTMNNELINPHERSLIEQPELDEIGMLKREIWLSIQAHNPRLLLVVGESGCLRHRPEERGVDKIASLLGIVIDDFINTFGKHVHVEGVMVEIAHGDVMDIYEVARRNADSEVPSDAEIQTFVDEDTKDVMIPVRA